MTVQNHPIPVTVISGFLGAGKTTLVNHLLRNADGRRIVVLVNDFGELPIDADLIESADGDTLNLANGCACCSMGGDLFNAFVNVLDRQPPPDHLIIEASGVADPSRIANFAHAEPDLVLDAIVSIVDGGEIGELIDDARLGPTIKQQMACANIIMSNKLDLVDASARAAIDQTIKTASPNAIIIPAQFCQVPVNVLLGFGLNETAPKSPTPMPDLHNDLFGKWSKAFKGPINREKFEDALTRLGREVIRLKGIVQFDNDPSLYAVHQVLGRSTITKLNPNQTPSTKTNKLIAIGLKPEFKPASLDQNFGDR